MYKYKGYVPLPISGQIDETIGITLAGYKASQMNSYKNIKTADKYLHFLKDKYKYMVVGKRVENIHIPNFEVDIWETSHDQEGYLKETFEGKQSMGNEKVLTYLGVELSADGKNTYTILKKRNRQIGKKKQILNILKPLGIFTFECAVILLNLLIRSSVLYGTEALYNITESEMRGIEQIEGDQMRNIFQVKTGIQVPFI